MAKRKRAYRFLIADYALTTRMTAGNAVLILAAGGLGLSAVQMAQRAGVEIFATAGSPQKRGYLQSLGITHIMSSRTLDFADEVMERTGGQGVDIVLNSLTGDFIPKSLSTLAQGGTFLEVGKAGIWTTEQVAAFRPDVSFQSIYMGEVPRPLIGAILRRLGQALGCALKPLPIASSRRMQRGIPAWRAGTSKVAVVDETASAGSAGSIDARIDGNAIPDYAAQNPRSLRRASSRRIWGSTSGADGPKRPSEPARAVLSDPTGRRPVAIVRGDVGKRATSIERCKRRRQYAAAARSSRRGRDRRRRAAAAAVDWFRGAMAQKPAARGPARATDGRPLDFVSVSSIAAVRGQGQKLRGQRLLGARALSARSRESRDEHQLGPVGEVGMAASLGGRSGRLTRSGVSAIGIEQGLTILEEMLDDGPAQPCVWGVDWSTFLAQYPPGQEPRLLSELAAGVKRKEGAQPRATTAGPTLLQQLEEIPPNKRWNFVMTQVRGYAIKVLGTDQSKLIEPQQALNELGLDSLMAVELRNALGAAVGRSLPATLLFKYPSLQALTDYLAYDVLAVSANEAKVDVVVDQEAAAIAPLSDDEVSRLLAEEIRLLSQN